MHTNTSGITTAFSDLEPIRDLVYPPGRAILDYLHLPFLSEDIRAMLDIDAVHLNADSYTFHPDLPGLAFAGMWDQSGGYFVPLELQARWIAYTWGGAIPPTSEAVQRSSIDAYRSRRGTPQKTRMNLAVLAIARAAGVEPSPDHWPHLRRALLFGPLTSSCFRLEGPDALPDASARFARGAAWFGAIASNDLADREQKYWSLVQDTMADELSPRNLPAKGADRMFRTDSAADFYSHALAFDPRRTSRRP